MEMLEGEGDEIFDKYGTCLQYQNLLVKARKQMDEELRQAAIWSTTTGSATTSRTTLVPRSTTTAEHKKPSAVSKLKQVNGGCLKPSPIKQSAL